MSVKSVVPAPVPAVRSASSPAKVNLSLRVIGRRSDGYHLLDSLTVFPAIGDFLEVEPSNGLNLVLDGPQGASLDVGPDNLVLRAALALRAAYSLPDSLGAAIRLDKRLPIAGGVGGGSSNAATTLKLLSDLWGLDASDRKLAEIGITLGADVPVCLRAPRPQMMRGIGEQLQPAPALPAFWLVLVNPGVGVPTGEVFRNLAGRFSVPPPLPPASLRQFDEFVGWLTNTGNDLEAPAAEIAPSVSEVIAALRAQPGCSLARMSGSGGTCFGLFESGDRAMDASASIGADYPGWWTAAGPAASGT